jgi:hypothetical protein
VSWDGRERRKVAMTDHDLLIKIDANLNNLCENFRTHKTDFIQHTLDDKICQGENDDRFKKIEAIIWRCAGGLTVIVILLKFMFK